MKKVFLGIALVAGIGMVGSGYAAAPLASGTITVTGTVAQLCTVNSPTLAFSAISANKTTTATVTVTCNTPSQYYIYLDGGQSADINNRAMKSATSNKTIPYNIYKGSLAGGIWGNTAATKLPGPVTPDLISHDYTAFGQIGASPILFAATDYTDTVNISIDFTP